RRKQVPVLQDLVVADTIDLAERHGHPERRGAPRVGHRPLCAAGYDLVPSGVRRLDTVTRQQRAFDLTKMHILRNVDTGIRHRHANSLRGLFDLGATAELLRHEVASMSDA